MHAVPVDLRAQVSSTTGVAASICVHSTQVPTLLQSGVARPQSSAVLHRTHAVIALLQSVAGAWNRAHTGSLQPASQVPFVGLQVGLASGHWSELVHWPQVCVGGLQYCPLGHCMSFRH
jgi:hypothetical protein